MRIIKCILSCPIRLAVFFLGHFLRQNKKPQKWYITGTTNKREVMSVTVCKHLIIDK